MFRELSSAFYWTPAEIGELTLTQAAAYLQPPGEAAATRRGDATTMLAFARARRREKEAWVEGQREAMKRAADESAIANKGSS